MDGKPGSFSHAFEAGARPLRLAVVEDNLLIAMDIELSIEEAGHAVVGQATTAGEAIALAEAEAPDAMLMDLRLADGSCGKAAAGTILSRLGIRSVFLSGNLTPETQAELAPLQPIAMLNKPFSPADLTVALEAVCAAVTGDRAKAG